ncbi:MAG: glutathione S-transferase family protein [Pseudomonadota bacterium]
MAEALTLYSNPMSRGRTARWMLEEVGAPYDVETLEFGTPIKAPAFLAINPMGKVPAISHGDRVVTEVAAICAYLADAFPEAGLAPPVNDRADYYRWMFFTAGPLEAAMTNRVMGFALADEQRQGSGYGSYDVTVSTIADAVAKSDFIAGDTFSAADLFIGSMLEYALNFEMIAPQPALTDYVARVTDRDGHKRANDKDNALMAASEDGAA